MPLAHKIIINEKHVRHRGISWNCSVVGYA